MQFTPERQMVMQAVLDGQLSSEHVTCDELMGLYHNLTDVAMEQAMWAAEARADVTVFVHDWEYERPN